MSSNHELNFSFLASFFHVVADAMSEMRSLKLEIFHSNNCGDITVKYRIVTAN